MIMEKTDYNGIFKKAVAELDKRPALLLHVCCAPCLAGVIGRVEKHFDVTLFYYNPNIKPRSEYDKRLGEIKKYLSLTNRNMEIIDGGYDEKEYSGAVCGYEKTEGGDRCNACCGFRAEKTAGRAKADGYDYFCTTLTVSPHKNAERINTDMHAAARKFGVKCLPSDFKKEGGFLVSAKECEKYDIYRQNYCGCSPRKITVFVTGGIASGKSAFVRILGELGAYTISADDVARGLIAEGTVLNKQIKAAFPSAVAAGRLDRAALKKLIFEDENGRQLLNKMTHAAVFAEIADIIEQSGSKIIVAEVPLLFESGFDPCADITLAVSSDLELRRKRMTERDGDGGMFDLISSRQMTDAEREARADVVVRNDDDIEQLRARAKELYDTWRKIVSA